MPVPVPMPFLQVNTASSDAPVAPRMREVLLQLKAVRGGLPPFDYSTM